MRKMLRIFRTMTNQLNFTALSRRINHLHHLITKSHEISGLILGLISALLFVFISCEEPADRIKILQGATHKLKYSGNVKSDEPLTFQWEVQKQPENNELYLMVDGYRALFTPDAPGYYDIRVWVIDLDGQKIDSQEFRFLAQKNPEYHPRNLQPAAPHQSDIDNAESADLQTVPNDDHSPPEPPSAPEIRSDIHNISSTAQDQYLQLLTLGVREGFTVQVSAFLNHEDAISQFNIFNEMKLPVFLQEFTDQNHQKWFRIRLGLYYTRNEAENLLNSRIFNQNHLSGWITALELLPSS